MEENCQEIWEVGQEEGNWWLLSSAAGLYKPLWARSVLGFASPDGSRPEL